MKIIKNIPLALLALATLAQANNINNQPKEETCAVYLMNIMSGGEYTYSGSQEEIEYSMNRRSITCMPEGGPLYTANKRLSNLKLQIKVPPTSINPIIRGQKQYITYGEYLTRKKEEQLRRDQQNQMQDYLEAMDRRSRLNQMWQLNQSIQQIGQTFKNAGDQIRQQSQSWIPPQIQPISPQSSGITTYRQFGNTWMGPNGSSCQVVGQSILCSDGKKCQMIGQNLICN